MQPPFKIIVNGLVFEVSPENAHALDIKNVSDSGYHVLENNKSFHIELINKDAAGKNITVRINGNTYTTKVSDKYDRLIDQLGMKIVGVHRAGDIKAPMPGLVLDILVEVGQFVKKGDKVLILEAMKMENIIKASGDGTIKTVHTVIGTPVEKGALLIEIE